MRSEPDENPHLWTVLKAAPHQIDVISKPFKIRNIRHLFLFLCIIYIYVATAATSSHIYTPPPTSPPIKEEGEQKNLKT